MTVLRSGSASHVGRVRTVNEDLALESLALFAVADGMGGHVGGEVAARTAIEALEREFVRHPSLDGLAGAVQQANHDVWERSLEDPELRGMGTTLTVAALVSTGEGDRLVMANVGDSRSYRMRNGDIAQLSHDHSVAEELVDRGELSEAEAAIHPHRHILTRALGVGSDVEVDLWQMTPRTGDRYVLCSDGLTNEVTEARMAKVLSSTPDPQRAAENLVRMAVESGGNDNVTVVVLYVLVGEDEADGDGPAPHDNLAPAGTPAAVAAAAAAAASVSSEGADAAVAMDVDDGDKVAPGALASGGSSPLRTVRSTPTPMAANTTEERPVSLLSRVGSDAAAGMRAMSDRAAEVSSRLRTRRITLRVLLFVVVLAAIVAGGFAVVRWYVDSSYYVKVHDGQVVIFEGRMGGFLGFAPKVVDRTGVAADQVPPAYLQSVVDGVQEPSLRAAKAYVKQIEQIERTQSPTTPPPSSSSTTSTTGGH
jgi:PPM family protein phosphatase